MNSSPSLTQTYHGLLQYVADYPLGADTLLVAIPCQIEERPDLNFALLDPASHWSVMPGALPKEIGLEAEVDPYDATAPRLLTGRSGLIRGQLTPVWVRLHAEYGNELDLQVTCFVWSDWTGPFVLGWKGCLEGFRFGLDPSTDSFYFGPI